ncbi:ubiquinone/menaquinone biosynthesis methyltransferase [Acidobacteriota bacterium]
MKKGIQKIFSEVAETYEIVNHVLTFGMDIVWRKKAARLGLDAGDSFWLDICSGTGEMAQNLSRYAKKRTRIVSVDFNDQMLSKALEKKHIPNLSFVLADAEFLPFKLGTFDLLTISFATRNINLNKKTLINRFKEFHRILKPGGYFINLETSQPRFQVLRKLFHLYVKFAVKNIGFLLSGSRSSYIYLSSTIPRFFCPEELSSILYHSGFAYVSFRSMLFGIAAIHISIK